MIGSCGSLEWAHEPGTAGSALPEAGGVMPERHGCQSAGAGDWSRTARRRWFADEVNRLMDRLYGTALRLARNPDEAENLVAEAVANAWARLDDLRDPERFEGWLFRILHNQFISQWRRARTRQACTDEVAEDTHPDTVFSLFRQLHQPFLLWWSTTEDVFFDAMLQEDVRAAIDGLPDAFRIVVVLVEIEGYSYAEAASALDAPIGTVRSRLSRGRALLQKALWTQARDAGLTRGAGEAGPS